MDNNKKSNEIKLKIIVDSEIGQGKYSNTANISHSQDEFTIDFLYINPVPPPFGKMVSRVILTPRHIKRLLNALNDNLAKYEHQFGEIDISQDIPPSSPVGGGSFN